MKRAQVYKGNNVIFYPETLEAFSYGWWKFVGTVEGKVIFNNYRYSMSTSRHQSKVRALLKELNIKIDIEMPLPEGLPGTHRQSLMGDIEITASNNTLADLIVASEEHLCNKFLNDQLRKQNQYQRAKAKRLQLKQEALLSEVQHVTSF